MEKTIHIWTAVTNIIFSERYDILVDISMKYFQQNLTVSHKERKRDGRVKKFDNFSAIARHDLVFEIQKVSSSASTIREDGRHIWCNSVNRRLWFLVIKTNVIIIILPKFSKNGNAKITWDWPAVTIMREIYCHFNWGVWCGYATLTVLHCNLNFQIIFFMKFASSVAGGRQASTRRCLNIWPLVSRLNVTLGQIRAMFLLGTQVAI